MTWTHLTVPPPPHRHWYENHVPAGLVLSFNPNLGGKVWLYGQGKQNTCCHLWCIKGSADERNLRSTLISLNTTQARIQTPSRSLQQIIPTQFKHFYQFRMNKLLMLAFMVTLMGLMATASPQEEVEELELEDLDEDDALEEVAESREAREAGRNGRGECRGRNCQNRRPKKGLKKGRKAQKKSAKKSRKSKKSKKAKKAGKSEKAERGGSKGSSRSQGGCGRSSTDYTCLINAMTYLNLTKTQVANYLKQQGRIVAANKTGEKKNGKKGIFASTAQRIIRWMIVLFVFGFSRLDCKSVSYIWGQCIESLSIQGEVSSQVRTNIKWLHSMPFGCCWSGLICETNQVWRRQLSCPLLPRIDDEQRSEELDRPGHSSQRLRGKGQDGLRHWKHAPAQHHRGRYTPFFQVSTVHRSTFF